MEPVNLGYSTKNIPVAQPQEYLKCLIEKTEHFLRRVRWKAYHFLNPSESQTMNSFGFPTTKSPPPIKELSNFENKMLSLIQKVEFKNRHCNFQKKLAQDRTKIQTDEKMFIPADKTTNFYRLDTNSYNQLLNTTITKSYRKASNDATRSIISEEKKIAEQLNLDNKIDALAPKSAFITLKDHKPNFKNNPTCRLINPSKSEIGIISKRILQRINSKIRTALNLNQWKNTDSVLTWFTNIQNKSAHSFITFDIIDFYPSISEALLLEALAFGSQYDKITDHEKEIIMQAKKSLLFNDHKTWCKKDSDSLFDVTMGSFDGAETCELVGCYMLSKLTPEFGNNIGLYRDDGLAAFNKSPKEIENIKKRICKVFSDYNLRLTIEANKKCVNYLDVTLDLRSGRFKPFMKPGNVPQYINRSSDHPPAILRSIPEAINRRLSNISSDRESFEATKSTYQDALRKSGYDYELNFKPEPPKPKRPRSRNIIWFNPPFSANVATNIGHKFLQIIDECFPPNHALRKICNRNSLKLSYSCMPNMANIIASHNKRVLANNPTTPPPATTQAEGTCNCRNKDTCPLQQKCLTEGIVYQATVERCDNKKVETYIGLTEGTFKSRYNNHLTSFRRAKHRHRTALSKYIWQLKDSDVAYSISWRIIKKRNAYSRSSKKCNLCLNEKFFIICHPELSSLNTRNELISVCKHRNKHLLSNYNNNLINTTKSL